MCMKKGYIVLVLSMCSFAAFGGTTDSLLRLLSAAKTDTAKISLLFQIEEEYVKRNADSAMYYLKQCRVLMDKTNDTTNEFQYYLECVLIYHTKADYTTALHYCNKTIDVAKKNGNKQQEARAYRALFNIYHNLRQFDLAIKYSIYSTHLSESIGDTLNIAINYGNLCWLYIDISQYQKAIYYGLKGIEAGKKYNDVRGLLISLNNTALAYWDINNCQKAIDLFKEQLILAQKENIPRSVHKALSNLCLLYAQLGDKDNVLKYAKLYNDYVTNNNIALNRRDQSFKYLINANVELYENNLQETERLAKEGIKIAEEDSITQALLPLYQLAANVKYAQHDYQMGSYYLSKWDSVDQSQMEEELSVLSMDLEAKYQSQKKENEILKQQQQLHQRNIWIGFLIGSVVLLSILSFLVYRYFKQRNFLLEKEKIIQQQRISELEKEKQLQATEAILKGQEEERSRIAKDLHDGLGGLLSGVKYSLNNMKENVILSAENATSFTRSIDMLDSGIQELRRIAHNMMPENLVKFGLDNALKDYCHTISTTNVVPINYSSFQMQDYHADMNVSITIYRIIQELINNTIKHANASEMIVQLSKEEGRLHITVEDNGKGFDVSNIHHFKGAGWANIQNRVNYLKGKIDIDSNAQNGTSINIEIPLA